MTPFGPVRVTSAGVKLPRSTGSLKVTVARERVFWTVSVGVAEVVGGETAEDSGGDDLAAGTGAVAGAVLDRIPIDAHLVEVRRQGSREGKRRNARGAVVADV